MRLRMRDQNGTVLVYMAVFAPVAILLASFVMDIGNWFGHQRHLQLQADAAVLAGAQKFVLPCSSTIDTNITNTALQYSGVSATQYNQQIGGTNRGTLAENFNQPDYPDPSQANGYQVNSPVDTTVHAIPPAAGAQFAGPCEADMLDVKMNEIGLPWWFRAAGVPYINAHARVEIRQETSGSGFVPMGVDSNNPVAGEAFFVNEDSGSQLPGTNAIPLSDTGNTDATTGEEIWCSSTAVVNGACTSFSFTVPTSTCSTSHSCTPHIGVVFALAGDASQLTNSMTTACAGSLVGYRNTVICCTLPGRAL